MRNERPSMTARKVALNVVTLGTIPEMAEILPPGISDATATLLVKSGVVSSTAVQCSRSRKIVTVYKAFDWMMPGQFEAFAYRKAFCEHQVREGINAGSIQILVLGAGYDTMGWRLAPEFTDVNFFEIDRPGTSRLKAKGIHAMGQRPNLHLIAEDLSKRDLVLVLRANKAWNPISSTVVIAEGLLMYLPADAVRTLFCHCAAITGPNSRFAFTYIGTQADGRPDAGRWTSLAMWILEAYDEPWLWCKSPEELCSLLKETGWSKAPELSRSIVKYGVEFVCCGVK